MASRSLRSPRPSRRARLVRPLLRLAAALSLLVAWCAHGATARAQQPVPTCVSVQTTRSDARELERLVESEVARHPTHVVVPLDASGEENCRTHLQVELIEVAEGRFVTGRLDSQVPYRVRVDPSAGGLAGALEELVRVVLHNDPVTLEGPRRESFFAASLGKLRREGRMLYEVEAFEWGALVAGEAWQAPGLAFRIRREVGAWHVGARVGGSARPHDGRPVPEPIAHIAAHLELAVFASALADTSVYASAMVGLEHQRLTGPAPLLGPSASGSALATGLSFGFRGGVELLRTTDVRFDLFGQIFVPAFVTRDQDGGVIDAWLPSAMIGAGAAF